VYAENLVEEAVFLLAEWLTSGVVHGSVAFPEVSIQVTVSLRKALKSSRGDSSMVKEAGLVRGLVDRIEDSAQWMERKRSTVTFSPGNDSQVEDWERTIKGKIDESPMGKYFKILQKTREKRRKLIDKVCVDECPQYSAHNDFRLCP
jgi:nucleolar complex protein 2